MDSPNWREKLEQFKIPIALSLLGLVLIIGGVLASGLNKQQPNPPAGGFPKESLVQNQKFISVDVSGAVQKPGVYKFTDGSRIEQAIKEAGGFSQEANQEYISKYLNMAQKLSDGSKVYVPFAGEQVSGSQSSGVVAGVQASNKVNINTANSAELEGLPDIGTTRAAKIISGRQYAAIEDLVSKKIISPAIFEKIKDLVSAY
ncbi:helix-hairpin-helix domain-containing protein [Candidatus Daviesbacteria bacterium]|nr:helix-hairpin-helix domain-containing protein [Candidatus Daviesbacteria bacterium]